MAKYAKLLHNCKSDVNNGSCIGTETKYYFAPFGAFWLLAKWQKERTS